MFLSSCFPPAMLCFISLQKTIYGISVLCIFLLLSFFFFAFMSCSILFHFSFTYFPSLCLQFFLTKFQQTLLLSSTYKITLSKITGPTDKKTKDKPRRQMGGAMGWDKDDMILSLISWRTDRAFLCLLRNCVHTVCYVYFYIILSYKLRLDSCLPLIVFFLHLFVSLSLFFQFFFFKK